MKYFLLLIAPILLFSQTINKITFENLYQISPTSAKEIIGITSGDEASYEKINESLKVLYKNRFFKNIEVYLNGSELIYKFEEKPVIAKIDIKGMFKDKQKDILQALGLKKGNIYDEEKIKVAKVKLLTLLESMGQYDSIITTSVDEFKPGSLKVTLHINKGEDIRIKKINFLGTNKIKYNDFEGEIENNEQDTLGWLWGRNDGKLKLHALNSDSHKIKDYYMSKGYLDADVSPASLKVSFDGYFANLDYSISEGGQYHLDSIDISSNNSEVDIVKIKSELSIVSGDVFNIKKIRNEMKKINEYVQNLGFALAQVNPKMQKDDINKKVSLNIQIQTNQKIYVRDVKIAGNSTTIDRVIRREVYLAPGDLFKRVDLKDSINALKRTGYFGDVDIETIPISNTLVDLLVKVKEAPTGSIVGGIGYSSSEGFLINAKFSDRNIFGSGIEIGVDFDRSNRSSNGRLYFNNPRIFDSKYTLGGSVFKNSFETDDFKRDSKGFDLVVGKKLTRNISASVRFLNEKNNISEFPDDLAYLYEKTDTLKQSILPTIAYNSTDDFYVPRSGIKASIGGEYAGFGGDEKFNKVFMKFATFYSPEFLQENDFDIIFRYRAKIAFLKDEGYIPISSKYYLGGNSSIRGYDFASLSPRDDTNNTNRIGGDRYFSHSLEASIPLIKDAKMRLFAFIDDGAIGDGGFDIKRKSIGLGVSWISPVGPIQFIFPKAIGKKDGDETSNFEFTFGTSF